MLLFIRRCLFRFSSFPCFSPPIDNYFSEAEREYIADIYMTLKPVCFARIEISSRYFIVLNGWIFICCTYIYHTC